MARILLRQGLGIAFWVSWPLKGPHSTQPRLLGRLLGLSARPDVLGAFGGGEKPELIELFG